MYLNFLAGSKKQNFYEHTSVTENSVVRKELLVVLAWLYVYVELNAT